MTPDATKKHDQYAKGRKQRPVQGEVMTKLMNYWQVACWLDLPRRRIAEMASQGLIPHARLPANGTRETDPRLLRFDPEILEEWLSALQEGTLHCPELADWLRRRHRDESVASQN